MTEVELDDDDPVTVIDSANNYRRSYHADPEDCQSVHGDHSTTTVTKAKAERMNLDPCSWCVVGVDTSEYDRSAYEAAKAHNPEPIDEVVNS